MRSSVSYILSSSTSEPNMSHPDYEQYSHDHAALLVLIKHIGNQLKPKTFTKFYDRISKINSVKITDSSGNIRTILIRYVREHPVENNDWGDFQTHRRLLGLISLGKYDSQTELNEICRVHESLKVKYTSTLFDSRCILFGPTKEANASNTPSPTDTSSSSSNSNSSTEAPSDETRIEKFTTPSNFKTRGLFYDESGPCSDLEGQIVEFINSLFWVLESKRLERSREKLERVSLLLAPFEKKDFVGLDMESRNNKKKCTGRMTKHLGDLCLQSGLLAESLVYYNSAAETLKTVNDWLWLGAAYEGLCAASALVLYPEMQRNVPLQRNASLQEGSSPKKTISTVASSTPLDVGVKKASIPNTLAPEDISKRYREAIIHYSKYQNAGIIETEASFKAARISVEQNHSLQAASFLQNVVYINITLSEQEKIQRFETLAELYTQIGFIRKAAFCQRLAATRYVSAQNPAPNWGRCYNLMLQSLPGHRLSLDPAEMREVEQGWPVLQIQLLQQLVVAAKRMGHSALATRHMTFLLQTMWPHLNPGEQKELSLQLQSLSAQCEGSPVPLVLDNGIVIPPANLTNIPVCQSYFLRNLKPHLQPRKIQPTKQDTGPFLFTPIHFGSLDRRNTAPDHTKMNFLWVENEPCEVTLKLSNPLPFELKVSDMRLLTSGVVFESLPETVILPPTGAPPTALTLHGTPRESEGQLQLLGYSTHTLGVKSNCRLRHMNGFQPYYEVEVVPALPLLEIKTSLPLSSSFSSFHDYENVVTSASVSLYHGESLECTVTIKNIGHVDVEMLEVTMQSVLEPNLQDQMFTWSKENLLSQLPLKPNQSASLTLYIYAAGSFLMPSSGQNNNEFSSGVFSSSISGPGSLPSRLNSPTSSSFHRNLNSSFRSSNSGHSSMSVPIPQLPINQHSTLIEGQLQMRYSGGPGLKAEYCRSSSVFFTVETIPSLHVINWDVLPAETNTQFYLVLDIANLTAQEMELQYTPSKTMHVEGHESCRVPVPVKRCPLSKLDGIYGGDSINNSDLDRICSEHIANLVDLRWHLLGTDTRGKASLKGITLTNDMLDEVRMSPLVWEVVINDDVVRPQEEINCEAGDCLNMKIIVTNSLEKALNQLTLSVQFYQDYENGTVNYRMETRLATAGTTKKYIELLEPQGKDQHECNIIFFTPGQYKIDLKSSAPENSIGNGCLQATGHIWRFTPPINVVVN